MGETRPPAPPGDRLRAWLFDACAVALIWAVAAFALVPALLGHLFSPPTLEGLLSTLLADTSPTATDSASLVFKLALYPPVSVAYYTLFEGLTGRTEGKERNRLCVVRLADGEKPGLYAAFLRSLLRSVDGLFFGLVGLVATRFTAGHRRLGDLAAGTVVVRDTPAAARRRSSGDAPVFESVEEAKIHAGQEGERRLQETLMPFAYPPYGFNIYFGVEHRAFGDIDALLVGPGGVYIVEAKSHRGTVSADVNSGTLLRDGMPFEKDFHSQVSRQWSHLGAVLFGKGERSTSEPLYWLIVFTRATVQSDPYGVRPAGVYTLEELPEILAASRPVLDERQVEALCSKVERIYQVAPAFGPAASAGSYGGGVR